MPSTIPRPLLIESREHIPLIAAGCTESFKRVQAVYHQAQPSGKIAALLLKYNARIKGSGALPLASRYGKMDMVKFLLIRGALIDDDCVTCHIGTVEQDAGGTALHLVKRGRVDILKHLLEEGANTTLMDHKGRTPLEKFLSIKDMKLVRALKDTPVAEPKKKAT